MNCHLVIACRAEGTLELHRFSGGILERIEVLHGYEGVNCLAYDAREQRLYASQTGRVSHVTVFNVFQNGDIEPAGSFDLPHQTAYISVAEDALWSASYHDGNIAYVPLNPDGMPSAPAQTDSFGENAHCIITAPDGRHTYATSLRADVIAAYSVENSELRRRSLRSVTPSGAGPRHLAFVNDETLLAVTEMTGEVIEFRRDVATGELTELTRVSMVPEGAGLTRGVARYPGGPEVPARPIWAADVQATCELIFATERTTSTVTAIRHTAETVADEPELEVLEHIRTEERPRATAVSPDGKYFVVGGETSSHASVYRVNHDHDPSAVDAHYPSVLDLVCRVQTGENPAWFAFLP
ncbi:lactonase family protein [Neomicrococcus lactis]|uniref:6-phosphogluconolactonase n=1 Tax=Neomicrococcus lactis TaxID=732241 RepID=A0A7W8YCU0_9MICC|nr:beta-propeller fold lactonase family protein [Neomicrococcus lactis]MBB5599022.1 6-phosphogluconolactonase [Neomicrococcus lactis]